MEVTMLDFIPIVENQTIREYAHEYVIDQYRDAAQWQCFKEIVFIESRWKHDAFNPTTKAYGLGQLIDSKKYTKGKPKLQIRKMLEYITHRYPAGLACQALKHHKTHDWY
jgi:hypothetical protein